MDLIPTLSSLSVKSVGGGGVRRGDISNKYSIRNFNSNTSITIQCNVHVYVHIHISRALAAGWGRPAVSHLNPRFFEEWSITQSLF